MNGFGVIDSFDKPLFLDSCETLFSAYIRMYIHANPHKRAHTHTQTHLDIIYAIYLIHAKGKSNSRILKGITIMNMLVCWRYEVKVPFLCSSVYLTNIKNLKLLVMSTHKIS